MLKSVYIFAATLFLFASVNTYPANDKTDLSDIDAELFGGEQPIVDTGYYGGYYPSLDGFYKRLQDVISSIRQRIAGDETSFIQTFGDLGKGNSTSYTKIVGNHKVEVNETEYKKDTDYGTSHVKVSYINVRPLNPDTVGTGTAEPDTEIIQKATPKDRESLEDSGENEIANVDEAGPFDDIETFDVFNTHSNNFDVEKQNEIAEDIPIAPYKRPTYAAIDDVSNDIDSTNVNNEVRDLSGDTYINDLMMADGAPFNPDAEFI